MDSDKESDVSKLGGVTDKKRSGQQGKFNEDESR